jgi:hypothetical protein
MKKSVLWTLMASISIVSASAAYADDPVSQPDATDAALTTKGYVDAGLQYVYKSAKDDAKAISDKVGNTTMTTQADTVTGAINELKTAITNINNAQEYTDGTGIEITKTQDGKNVVGLDLGETENNATYVFKTDANGVGSWQTVEVEDSWDSGFLKP